MWNSIFKCEIPVLVSSTTTVHDRNRIFVLFKLFSFSHVPSWKQGVLFDRIQSYICCKCSQTCCTNQLFFPTYVSTPRNFVENCKCNLMLGSN